MEDLLPPERTDRAVAFELARRKFAGYALVSGRTDGNSTGYASGGSRLRTPASLQVDGALAAQLDEADYLLTGILDAAPRGRQGDGAVALNVVELSGLLQSQALHSALVSGSSCDVCDQLRQVLRLLLPARVQEAGAGAHTKVSGGDRNTEAGLGSDLLRLSLSVLAHSLTQDAEVAAVVIDERAFAAIVGALKAETDAVAASQRPLQTAPAVETGRDRSDQEVETSAVSGRRDDEDALQGPSASVKPPLKKPSLRRKQTASQDGMSATDNGAPMKIQTSSDAAIRTRLLQLVNGDAALLVASYQQSLSTADVLCATLDNLLQIENPVGNGVREPQDATVAPRREDRDAGQSFTEPPTQSDREQLEANVSLDQRQTGGAHVASRASRVRKAWLVRYGGLSALLQLLRLRLSPLVDVAQPQLSRIHSLKENDGQADIKTQQLALHQLGAVLQVLEQAAFFAGSVQHGLSTSRELFAMLLGIVRVLGDLCWGSDALWTSSPSTRECATEAVDVFLAAMRLLINLTHQNAAADAHISSLDGMKVLFGMFCHVWHLSDKDAGSDASSSTQAVAAPSTPAPKYPVLIEEKLVFDACLLLLSAMANCVEHSEENRRALSQLTPAASMTNQCEAPVSACSVLTQFFLAKVQSYKPLIDGSSDNHEAEGGSNPYEDADWSPDDVILGGCSALLLGCLMSSSSDNVAAVLEHLPDSSPRLLLRALAVFAALHAQIGALTAEVAASVLRVETALNRMMLQEPRSWSEEAPDADDVTQLSLQEEHSAKTTTPTYSDIMSPSRATPVRHRKPGDASPSPGRATQRRRNLYASLSDSDDESGTGGEYGSSMTSGVVSSSDGGRPMDEARSPSIKFTRLTPTRSSPTPKTPPRSRCTNRSSPSSFCTPSPSRRKRTPKSSERQTPRDTGGVAASASAASTSSASRRLLKEARSLIEHLDAEFERAGCSAASASPSQPRTLSSVSTSSTAIPSASSERWSRDRDEDGNGDRAIASTTPEATDCKAVELIKSEDSPVSTKKTEKKRKRKNYRLPTSPFRRARRPPASGGLRSSVSSIFDRLATNLDDLPWTPERSTEAANATPSRQLQAMSGLRIAQSPASASPARRKPKGVRAVPPPLLSAAIFDFDE